MAGTMAASRAFQMRRRDRLAALASTIGSAASNTRPVGLTAAVYAASADAAASLGVAAHHGLVLDRTFAPNCVGDLVDLPGERLRAGQREDVIDVVLSQ